MEAIVVGGCGQVARQRILPALKALAAKDLLRVGHVVDVLPPAQAEAALQGLVPAEARYHQLEAAPGELGRLLKREALRGRPVIVATPTPWHADHLRAALEASCPVALEKPLAASLQALDMIATCLARGDATLLFPLGYYLIEKGLPLLALARRGALSPAQLACLAGPDADGWASLRTRLGRVVSVTGVLREGPDARAWVLDGETGGHTLETFSHMIATSLPWVERLELRRAVLGSSPTVAAGRTESLMYAEFDGAQGERVVLGCQKWSPADVVQRWLRVDCEHGRALMDFDTQVLSVRLGVHETRVEMRAGLAKYEPQLLMFAEKIAHPGLRTEYALASESVRLALAVRRAGLVDGLYEHPARWLDQRLRARGGPAS